MNTIKKSASYIAFAFIGAVIALTLYSHFNSKDSQTVVMEQKPIQLTSYSQPVSLPQAQLPDLTLAAEKSVSAVVHITTKTKSNAYHFDGGNDIFEYFFGPRGYNRQEPQYSEAAGSGVIISEDGFIVTNNHVVDGAQDISVILNDNRKFSAKVIGHDPNTDIALVKIDAKNLTVLPWGDSEMLKLGEWVLAVGNPFNLTSTVTAGIVSAKSRSIKIMSGQMPIESFIQTDAAVNPGNSGGALVNSRGELVGINTAIASRTGSYSGYSFAIPASIVHKVVEDLRKYGEVQRALLGVSIADIDDKLAKEKRLDRTEGAYVAEVTQEGGAKAAGIKEGDVIVAINATKVNSRAQLQEQVGKHRPGDQVVVTVRRNGAEKVFNVTLKNTKGNTSIVKESLSLLGAEFGEISQKDRDRLNIDQGVQILKITSGKLKNVGVRAGFIITDVNKISVGSVEDIKRIVSQGSDKKPVLIEGVYPDGKWTYYVFDLNE
ncbi:MAG: Do family serine endopeptidase [Prolixibacteraceae bacterium]|jgi:Do/DeqQ family serine protease|nr:Do family serine endopeptidase [Prolixibacteraceae bacterium]